jgi:hypothetical protein
MNGKQASVIVIILTLAASFLLYAPEKTYDVNKNKDVFYSYSWMPRYYQGDLEQMKTSWQDRVYKPFLLAEYIVLLAAGCTAFYLLRSPARKPRPPRARI